MSQMIPSRARIIGLTALALLLCVSGRAHAQYMYLDVNGNGVHDALDQFCPAGPVTIDVWLDTSTNRDGSPSVCATEVEPLGFNSYEFTLHVTGGVVSWGTLTNRMPGFGQRLTRDGRDTTEVDYYHNGWGGSSNTAAGLYLVGTIVATPVSGLPAISIVTSHPGHGWMATGFGTHCAGSAAREHWHRLGGQWFDTDGAAAPPRPTPAGSPLVDLFPVSFSVNGPVDPHTEGIRDPRGAAPSPQVPAQPGNGTGFGIRGGPVPQAGGLPTARPGDVFDYAAVPVPSEAVIYQSEPLHGMSLGAPAGTNNQIIEPVAAGLAPGPGLAAGLWTSLPPAAPPRDNIDALSFGEDYFPSGMTVGLDPSMAFPDPPTAFGFSSWAARAFGPFKEPVVLSQLDGIGFRFSVDPWAVGSFCTALRVESGLGDAGAGLGPWTSPGGAAGDVFGTAVLRRVGGVTVGQTGNALVHDQPQLGLAPSPPPLAPMEDDLDALECVGSSTNWTTGAPMLTGSVHYRTAHVPANAADLPSPGTSIHEPVNETPVFFSVTRNSIGLPGSAVRSQVANDGGAAGDIFVMAKDPITGAVTNLLFIDESEIGLYAVDASPGGTSADDYTDDLDALILKVCPAARDTIAYWINYLMSSAPWTTDPVTGARTGYGMTVSITELLGSFSPGCIQVGFSVTTDAVGLEFTGVDWEAQPFAPPGAGSSAAGDIFYAEATGAAANPNYLWFRETDLGLDAGSWSNGVSTDLADLADNLDALDSTDSIGTATAVPTGDRPPEGSPAPRIARIYPNPAELGSTIRFELPREGRVRLGVYDVAGRLVAGLIDGKRPAGIQAIRWDGRTGDGKKAACGVYFLRLEFEGRTHSAKLAVLE